MRLVAFHVHALASISVPAGPVLAAVDYAADGLDAEIGVADGTVAGQRRGAAPHVKAVVSRAHGDVAPQEAVVVPPKDHEPIAAAASDQIAADDVAAAAEGRFSDTEADACAASANDDVAGDQVASPHLDADASYGLVDAVSGDHVSIAGGDEDALAVSNDAVASHLIAVARANEDCGRVL
jgi:hypothetical protein